ncbi:MoaD/ThiS family protein [Clostridium formicaceticum]|uniref:Molybdopterin synthase sulfur carrier subunit n=1 Tax=Clostridium formicaceticum TaxID=1497 RepID=A0AAC9RRV9_9CLOT|nr:MoaD/ThiS family protein [Clostridium formicaceticum]AOY75215.1 molybdopterin synthase sulfur carrier subunit [Clostridium formicaceticum]ARE89648.1 ThiS family protein [Clostridium formicaceticum]
MQVNVRLFATFRENREKEMMMDLAQGATPKDVIELLNIPEEEVAIILINGRHQELNTVLEDNDTLSLFPPVGGG